MNAIENLSNAGYAFLSPGDLAPVLHIDVAQLFGVDVGEVREVEAEAFRRVQ